MSSATGNRLAIGETSDGIVEASRGQARRPKGYGEGARRQQPCPSSSADTSRLKHRARSRLRFRETRVGAASFSNSPGVTGVTATATAASLDNRAGLTGAGATAAAASTAGLVAKGRSQFGKKIAEQIKSVIFLTSTDKDRARHCSPVSQTIVDNVSEQS